MIFMTVGYRFLGTGTTDANGVAYLTHGADGQQLSNRGYKGSGKGLTQIVSSTDDPSDISSSSFQSDTLPVIDAWMRDGGVTADYNTDDWFVQSEGSKTVQSDGTVFSADTGSLFAWINKHGTTHSSLSDIAEYSGDYCIEFTVVDVDTARFSIYEAYPSPKRVDVPLSVGRWKIIRLNNTVTALKNGESYPITSLNLTAPQRLGFAGTQGNTVKIKDVAVYGIGGQELGLTASKQTIQSPETTILTAYSSEGKGNSVKLYNASNDSLIGTMTDNSDGTYSYTYTGSGAGQVQFYAKLGNTQSNTYSVLDSIAYDKGLSGTGQHNDIWQDSNNMISRQSDGTVLTGSQWNEIALKLNNSTNIPFTDGLCFEFDLVDLDGQFRIAFNDGSEHQFTWNSADQYQDIGHWKFIINDGKITRQLDNGAVYELSAFDNTVSTFTFKFYAYQNFQSAKFKEFKMYPL